MPENDNLPLLAANKLVGDGISPTFATWQRWLYLAMVSAHYSRPILAWSTAPTIHREKLLNGVLAAVRRPRPRSTPIH